MKQLPQPDPTGRWAADLWLVAEVGAVSWWRAFSPSPVPDRSGTGRHKNTNPLESAPEQQQLASNLHNSDGLHPNSMSNDLANMTLQ